MEPNEHECGRYVTAPDAGDEELLRRLARIECLLDGLTSREAIGTQNETLKATLDQMSDRIAELGAGFGRIDRDMVVGLASMVGGFQRLDLDVTGSVGQISESLTKIRKHVRDVAGIGRRLDDIYASLEEVLRHPGSQQAVLQASGPAFGGGQVVDAAASAPLSTFRVIEELLPGGLVGRSDFAQWCRDSDVPLSLDAAELPRADADFVPFIRRFADLQTVLKPGDKLLWIQPLAGLRLNLGEAEQILGLVASTDLLFEHATEDGGRLLVACGTVRQDMAGLALRWSVAAMSLVSLEAGQQMLSRFEEFDLSGAIQCIDLPDDPEDANWEQFLKSTVAFLSAAGAEQFGICIPAEAFRGTSSERWDGCVRQVAAALDGAKRNGRELVQWVRGPLDVRYSHDVIAFAERHRIVLDLTPVSRQDNDNGLSAYDDERSYQPLRFDLRLPSFVAGNGPCCLARHSGRRLTLALRGAAGSVPDAGAIGLARWFFKTRNEDLLSRLWNVLDRQKADEYTDLVNKDLSRINFWADYHVYNWAPPPRTRLACFEFDAYELLRAISPVAVLGRLGALRIGKGELTDGRTLVEVSLNPASRGGQLLPAELRDVQVIDHAYLKTERPQITGDGLRLVEWLPERLGEALEIGSGFGVLAREIRRRADSYIGYDLSLDQAFAVRDLDCLGVVGDMNLLPFRTGSIDTVLADNVVEHSYDPLAAMREVNRVLRSRGKFFLILPLDYLSKEHQLRTHLWKADTPSILSAANLAGFEVIRYQSFGLAEAGVRGAFPSCRGMTSVWELTPHR